MSKEHGDKAAPKIKYVCEVCGGDNVIVDANIEWDVKHQKWAVRDVLDDGFCCDCNAERTVPAVPLAWKKGDPLPNGRG